MLNRLSPTALAWAVLATLVAAVIATLHVALFAGGAWRL